MSEPDVPQLNAHRWAPFRWPLALVALALIFLAGLALTFWFLSRSVQKTGEQGVAALKTVGAGLNAAAERFMKGTITATFTAAIPSLSRTPGGTLELASAQATESFDRFDAKTLMWDWVYLGTTVSEIKVPVTYRYHLRLSDPWRLDVSGNTCIVFCPAFYPTLPPAIDTERMEKRSERGWGRMNAGEQMAELEKSITPTLSQYARDRRHRGLVREECRKTVADFVRIWLLKEEQWNKDRFHTIKVIFPDEAARDVEQALPTIELKH